MGCQLPFSDEDSKMLDESRGYVNDLSPETYEEVMPEVRESMAEMAQRELAFEQNPELRKKSLSILDMCHPRV